MAMFDGLVVLATPALTEHGPISYAAVESRDRIFREGREESRSPQHRCLQSASIPVPLAIVATTTQFRILENLCESGAHHFAASQFHENLFHSRSSALGAMSSRDHRHVLCQFGRSAR